MTAVEASEDFIGGANNAFAQKCSIYQPSMTEHAFFPRLQELPHKPNYYS